MIIVKKVETKAELKKFCRFNYQMYKDNKYAVPELLEDMMDTFSQNNPAMEFCDSVFFLAYKDGKIVGRVAGIINRKANSTWNVKNVRFGWIDFIDDEEVSRKLIEAVEQWGKERGMTEIQGPLGFTDFDREGMLIEGFEEMGTMATYYNYPYYPQHLEKLGFEKESDWIEMLIKTPTEVPERLHRMAGLVKEKYNLNVLKFTSAKKIKQEYGQKIFELINTCYAPLFGYSKLSEKQVDKYVDTYLAFLDLDLVTLITDSEGKLISVGVSMPSMSEALRKAKGELFPFGWWHLLKALKWKQPKTLDLLLVGVVPEYQNKGVNAILFDDLIPIYARKGYEYVETNPELEVNTKVQSQWVYFDKRQHKRRRCFHKAL